MTRVTRQLSRLLRSFWPLGAAGLSVILSLGHAHAQPPAPGARVGDKVNSLVEDVVSAEVELEVTKRRSKILRMRADIFRAAVADPSILDFVAFGSREIEIIGKETGSTTVTLWLGDEQNAQLLSMLVTVVKDDAVDDKRRMEYSELEAMINEMWPNSRVQLIPIADKVIIRGQARDEEEALQIMSIVRENGGTVNANGYGSGGTGNLVAQGAASQPFPDASTLPPATIISMLEVPGEKQVMLKVRIAELKRSAVRTMGANFNFDIKEFILSSVLTSGANIFASGTFHEGSFDLILKWLAQNGSAKILAEPNLVVLSGHPATFLAGGEFAVPTVVGVGGAEAATTYFKGFGTHLSFTPTVLDKDRIRLHVSPTFSSLNRENAVGGVFGLDTRTTSTTVDLREGQVLAIAGLMEDFQRGDNSRVPHFGDIPGLNVLLSNKSISRDETELLILVTPELVHPLEPDQAPTILPGMEVTEPDDCQFFWYGDIEGDPGVYHRSTVWPIYKSKMKRAGAPFPGRNAQCSQNYYIQGSHGFAH
jgi:pilus assembly protein CpaC